MRPGKGRAMDVDREYVDRLVNDLRDRMVAELAAMQAEIDRRVAAERHEAELRLNGNEARLDSIDHTIDRLFARVSELISRDDFEAVTGQAETRLGKTEAALQQQRGRTAAYATVGSVLLILIALLTLILNHVHL